MNQWRKDIASWKFGKQLYLSIPFTWLLPEAVEMAKSHKGKVFAGGPAVDLMPEIIKPYADTETPCIIQPLMMHNPLATFTTRGCPNRCGYCAVPKIEGGFRELDDYPIRPVVCDNNLLESSKKHFDRLIDQLKKFPYVDFNQGLDARKFNKHHAERIAELKSVKVRFAFDHIGMEQKVFDAIQLARSEGLKNFGVYVLFGFKDTPEDALYRLNAVYSNGIMPYPMRYQPLDALQKNSYVADGWTVKELRHIHRYYSRLAYLEHVPFDEYKNNRRQMSLFI